MPSFHAIRFSNIATSMGEKKTVKMVIDKLHYDGVIYTHKTADTIPYPFAPEHLAQKEIGDTIYFFTGASVLSNHHPCNFIHNNVRYHSSEQFYFAKKAVAACDDASHFRIMNTRSAIQALNEGKKIKGITDSEWEPEALKIMKEGVFQKFAQSTFLKNKLLSTNGRLLAEASTNVYWGVGQHIRDLELGDKNKQNGENKMGDILMEVRESLMG